MNKFRKKSILMVLLILLIIVVSGFSLYSAYKVSNKKSNNSSNSKKLEKKEETEEIVIPDSTRVYKSLDKSIDVINYLYTSLDNKVTNIYKNEVNIEEVEDSYKLYSVLMNLYNEKEYDNITEEDYNRLYEGLYMEEKKEFYGSINYDDVSALYKKVYNKELGSGAELNIENYCPMFKFDNNKYYFGTYDCKNVSSKLFDYKYKYVIGDDSADVYVSLGIVEYDYDYKVYKYDTYRDIIFKESETDVLLDINRNNFNEYSKYIVHFVKVNDEFYVNNVRKVMD